MNNNKYLVIIIILTIIIFFNLYQSYNQGNNQNNQYQANIQRDTIIKKDTILSVKYDTIIKNIPYKNKQYSLNPSKTIAKNKIEVKLDTIINNDTISINYKEIDNLLKLEINYPKDTFRIINKESIEIRKIEEKIIEKQLNDDKNTNLFDKLETIFISLGLGFIIGIIFN